MNEGVSGYKEDAAQEGQQDSRGGLIFMQVLQLSFSGSVARARLSKNRQQRRVTALMITRQQQRGNYLNADTTKPDN